MTSAELEAYLHQQIPASKSLEIVVSKCGKSEVELTAPLEPNVNHKNTAFGGSMSVLAILAGWSLVFVRLEGTRNEIVIQQSTMSYLKPANSSFTANCSLDASDAWSRFSRSFTKKGVGRIQLNCTIQCEGEVVATFHGTYVAFNKAST